MPCEGNSRRRKSNANNATTSIAHREQSETRQTFVLEYVADGGGMCMVNVLAGLATRRRRLKKRQLNQREESHNLE